MAGNSDSKLLYSETESDCVTCDPCSRLGDNTVVGELGKALLFCVDCSENLCTNCQRYHKANKASSDHMLITRNEMQNKHSREFLTGMTCTRHHGNRVKFMCKDHGATYCIDCVVFSHRRCANVVSLDDALKGLKEKNALSYTLNTLADLLTYSKVIETRSSEILDTFEKDITNTHGRIKALRDRMTMAFDTFERNYNAKVKEYRKSNMKPVSLATLKENVSSTITRINTCASSEQLFIICYKANKLIESTFEELRQLDCDVRCHVLQNDVEKKIGEFTDVIKSAEFKAINSNAKLSIFPNLKTMEIRPPLLMHVLNTRVDDDDAVPQIVAAVFLAGSTVLCDRANKKVKLIDLKTKCLSQYKLSAAPFDVVKLCETEFAVSVPDNNKVVVLKVQKSSICHVKEIAKGFSFCGLTLTSNSELVGTTPDGSSYITAISMQSGRVVATIGTDAAGIYNFKGSVSVACDQKTNRCYCTSIKYHHLVCFYLAGSVTMKYCPNNLRSPTSVGLDRKGNIYVCGKDSRNIHQLSSSGQFQRILMAKEDGLGIPVCIAFSETSDMFLVSEENTTGSIKLYKFE